MAAKVQEAVRGCLNGNAIETKVHIFSIGYKIVIIIGNGLWQPIDGEKFHQIRVVLLFAIKIIIGNNLISVFMVFM